MLINYKENYNDEIKKLDSTLINNPAFKINFEYVVEDLLRSGRELNLDVLGDKDVILKVAPRLSDFPPKLTSNIIVLEAKLLDDGDLEINETPESHKEIDIICIDMIKME